MSRGCHSSGSITASRPAFTTAIRLPTRAARRFTGFAAATARAPAPQHHRGELHHRDARRHTHARAQSRPVYAAAEQPDAVQARREPLHVLRPTFPHGELTRDHITPISRGGRDAWTNVVTACRRCNNHKGGRTPEEARVQLVAVPFTPTYAEYIYLKGRKVLADQMQYLLTHFPRTSPLHARLRGALAQAMP